MKKEEIYLETPGYRLRVQQGMFHITVPDLNQMGGEEKVVEYAPHQVESILLNKDGGTVSISAIQLALENEVELFLTNTLGDILGVISPAQTKGAVQVQKAQYQLIGTPASMVFVKDWIGRKFQRTIQFFKRIAARRNEEVKVLLLDAAGKLEDYLRQLEQIPVEDVKHAMLQIRGCEGQAGRLYWGVLSRIVPPAYRFEKRTHPGAYDLYNAATNYAYGIMYRKVRRALLLSGVEPKAGFLHSMGKGGEAMVYDFIEPYRPWADELVYLLCNGKKLTGNHLVVNPDGGCRLDKKGRLMLVRIFQSAFEKKPEPFTGNSSSLNQLMLSDAKSFAWPAIERNDSLHPWPKFKPEEIIQYY